MIWEKSFKIVKESKPSSFFYIAHNVLLIPLPFQFYFSPQFFCSLLHNFIIFPPQCFYSLLHNFLLFFLLNVFYSPPPPPPPHFYCFLYTTITATFLLFSLHHHHRNIFIVFPSPPPSPPPHFLNYPYLSIDKVNFAEALLLWSFRFKPQTCANLSVKKARDGF